MKPVPSTSAASFDVEMCPPPRPRSILLPWVAVHLVISGISQSAFSVEEGGLFAALLGSTVIVVEWLVLRSWISHAGWWVPARYLGDIGSGLLYAVIQTEHAVAWSVLLLVAAFPPALAGWLVLRRSSTRAWAWMITTMLLAPSASLLWWPLEHVWLPAWLPADALWGGASVALSALVTGLSLQWMFKPAHRPADWDGPSVRQ